MFAKFCKATITAMGMALVMSIGAPALSARAATAPAPGIVLAEDCGTTAS
jgi:hypothetical protein